ncbi:hypothetical protein V6N11_006741 [Hibiscus sabdariffa]|uniref:Uncharacterized protein n=1 Tax=Hibiscus sabdariffa TaxID=183260 RepID=A0ABR2RRV2_9ROSI
MLGNPWLSFRVEPARRGAPSASRSKVIGYLRKARPEPHVQVPQHVAFSVITSSDLRELEETYHRVGMPPPA